MMQVLKISLIGAGIALFVFWASPGIWFFGNYFIRAAGGY